MEITPELKDKFRQLDRSSFEKLKGAEFTPPLDLMGLKYLRDRARNERDLRQLYRGRALYELLQNADDASAKKVAFILSADGLAFAHDGSWFTVGNFRSLADGWSDKDPRQYIGHKGLGFRSVLDITPSPFLIKVDADDFFAVKFTWALNNGHIQKVLQGDRTCRSQYEDWTKYGEIACPVMAIPGLAKGHNLGAGMGVFDKLIRGVFGRQFTTMFWFPAIDDDINPATLKELAPTPITSDEKGQKILLNFLEKEVGVLLPFLSSVQEVKVYDDSRCIGSASIPKQGEGEITIVTESNGQRITESFFQMRFFFPLPFHIKNKPDTPKALKLMDKVGIILSVQLKNGQPIHNKESRFYVYFPTEEPTGVGFIVHGDFFIKPDRTRLMPGDYNQWLLDTAAKKAANEFLTGLLQKYHARPVFEALSPTNPIITDAATLLGKYSTALRGRTAPFLPTQSGLLKREEVILPPTVDEGGFWETHFSETTGRVFEDKKAFLLHTCDGQRTRLFARLAQVQVVDPEKIVDLIEAASQEPKPADWWYECYSYMANDEKLYKHDHSFFAGRKLIPTVASSVNAVPKDSSLVVCLPPTGDRSSLLVPGCFSPVFAFLDPQLATMLEDGKDTVRSWVLDRFRISRFEATDLIPRAIRGVVTRLFSGQLKISLSELVQAWSFIKKIVDISRTILSSAFWQEVGRFPLPLQPLTEDTDLSPECLVPAFLVYWPDQFIERNSPILGVSGLRRIDEKFIYELVLQTRASQSEWMEFFEKCGVSATPKVLTYRRIVARDQDLYLAPGSLKEFEGKAFTGERQIDENEAVIETLIEDELWRSSIENVQPCGHNLPMVLQSLTIVHGLNRCVWASRQEYENGDDRWSERLWSLIRGLPVFSVGELENDKAFCRGGSPGGHSLSAGSYLRRQLEYYNWLPSSQGPASSSRCFLRHSSRRLISSGTSNDELGDKLLPYVAVDSIDDFTRLHRLGIEPLDDVGSSSPSALIRALALLGERLWTEWGRTEIVQIRGRWRLVRGAIQDIYRVLNQSQTLLECPRDTKFAMRLSGGVKFYPCPSYYAEPGSPIEQAFLGTLPLFDADRPYPKLFQQLEVTRLIPGQTVNENFLTEETSITAVHLREEIINGLAPYFLALIIARSEKSRESESILRRLREHFEVKTAWRLSISYSLIGTPSVNLTIDFPKFYLQRRIIRGSGAIQMAHYTLYTKVTGSTPMSILDLDADALGDVLAPLFLDGISEELTALFPRIATRYHIVEGNRSLMEDFMLHQLGVSRDAQDMAFAMVTGETLPPDEIITPPPPLPVEIVSPVSADGGALIEGKEVLDEKIRKHEESLVAKTTNFVEGLVSASQEKDHAFETTSPHEAGSDVERRDVITPEQRDRGKRGEEEIKRRLQLPGGWAGFIFIEDKRDCGCGYDFLCALEGRKVKLEVKTFILDGRVVLSSRELHEAAVSKDDYYLIGVLEDENPPSKWTAFTVRNPINILLMKGEFDIDTKLQVQAANLFDLDRKG